MEFCFRNHCFFIFYICVTYAQLSHCMQFKFYEASISKAVNKCEKFVLTEGRDFLYVKLNIELSGNERNEKKFTLKSITKGAEPEVLCSIDLDICSTSGTESCNCTEMTNSDFNLTYRGPAKQTHVGAQFSVNSDYPISNSFVQVHSFNDNVTLALQVDEGRVITFPVEGPCPSIDYTKTNEKSHVKFCAWGLLGPVIRLASKGHKEIEDARECLYISFDDRNEYIEFKFRDDCGRNGSYRCPIGVYQPPGEPPQEPPATDGRRGPPSNKAPKSPTASTDYLVPLLVGLVITAIILFVLFFAITRLVQSRSANALDSIAEG